MIVGVTGTSVAFVRMVNALAEYARANPEERVWLQHGPAALPPELEGREVISRAELLERMRQADVVVCHAGCGTLFDAVTLGHVPVVVPRRRHLKEHINDHQLELAEALHAQGRAIVVSEIGQLEDAISQARRSRAAERTNTTAARLRASLRSESMLLCARAAGSRTPWIALRALTAWVPLRLVSRVSSKTV